MQHEEKKDKDNSVSVKKILDVYISGTKFFPHFKVTQIFFGANSDFEFLRTYIDSLYGSFVCVHTQYLSIFFELQKTREAQRTTPSPSTTTRN
jgi:predicted transcriptional regulator